MATVVQPARIGLVGARRAPAFASVVGVVVLVLLAVLVLAGAQALEVRRVDALTCGHIWSPCSERPLLGERPWADRQLYAAAAVAGAMLLLAAGGRRWSFPLPALVLALGPALATGAPRALSGPGWSSPWLGTALEVGLLILPAAAVADRSGATGTPLAEWGSRLLVGSIAASLVHLWALRVGADGSSVSTVVAVLLAGILARGAWIRAALLGLPFAIAASPIGASTWPGSHTASLALLEGALVLGFAAEPTRRLLDHWVANPRSLLVGVNALNLADAGLTAFAVRAGIAAEANPLVRIVGLPVKVLLVGAASALIYRWRPRLLVVPLAVLVGVFALHLGGLIAGG